MATSMMAAPTVQMQSTTGGGEGERMRVVLALGDSKGREIRPMSGWLVMVECNEMAKTRAVERRGRRGSREGHSF